MADRNKRTGKKRRRHCNQGFLLALLFYDSQTNRVLADMVSPDDEVVVLKAEKAAEAT